MAGDRRSAGQAVEVNRYRASSGGAGSLVSGSPIRRPHLLHTSPMTTVPVPDAPAHNDSLENRAYCAILSRVSSLLRNRLRRGFAGCRRPRVQLRRHLYRRTSHSAAAARVHVTRRDDIPVGSSEREMDAWQTGGSDAEPPPGLIFPSSVTLWSRRSVRASTRTSSPTGAGTSTTPGSSWELTGRSASTPAPPSSAPVPIWPPSPQSPTCRCGPWLNPPPR